MIGDLSFFNLLEESVELVQEWQYSTSYALVDQISMLIEEWSWKSFHRNFGLWGRLQQFHSSDSCNLSQMLLRSFSSHASAAGHHRAQFGWDRAIFIFVVTGQPVVSVLHWRRNWVVILRQSEKNSIWFAYQLSGSLNLFW